jgi:hypothetical protein
MTHGAIEWIEIPVRELESSVEFYEQVFGWKIQREETSADHSPGYVMFQDPSGNVGGGFHSGIKPATEGTLIYISVDSIEDTLRQIARAGGSTLHPTTLIHQDVGWWAAFCDPAGNKVALYESAPK